MCWSITLIASQNHWWKKRRIKFPLSYPDMKLVRRWWYGTPMGTWVRLSPSLGVDQTDVAFSLIILLSFPFWQYLDNIGMLWNNFIFILLHLIFLQNNILLSSTLNKNHMPPQGCALTTVFPFSALTNLHLRPKQIWQRHCWSAKLLRAWT